MMSVSNYGCSFLVEVVLGIFTRVLYECGSALLCSAPSTNCLPHPIVVRTIQCCHRQPTVHRHRQPAQIEMGDLTGGTSRAGHSGIVGKEVDKLWVSGVRLCCGAYYVVDCIGSVLLALVCNECLCCSHV